VKEYDVSSPLVAVTGADGFIGSHLVELLASTGHRIRAMVQYNSRDSWGWLDEAGADTRAQTEVLPGDVRDAASVAALVEGAEVVYHLAALIAIPYSYRAPRSYVDTNVLGTLNVLEAVRAAGTPRLVHTSTSETYGTARTVPITEDHPTHGQSPYAASKVAADALVCSYHLSFGVPAVTLRPFNTFGPRQSARAVIPTVISQLTAGTRRVALGATDPTRDFLYVGDTAAAFLAAGSTPGLAGQVFNAGTGYEISIGDLANRIAKVMDVDAEFGSDADRYRPANSEVMRLVCDSTRLRAATGWAPGTSLEEGLAATVRWFHDRTDLAAYRPGRYTI
jgi:NDP-hexose 4,6-dehydratase